jgi:hypothetical protein
MTNRSWTVRVDWLEPTGPLSGEFKMDAWTTALAVYSPAISLEPGGARERATATITLTARSLRVATQTALVLVEGVTKVRADGIEVLTTEEFDRRECEPQIPPLIGQTEMARKLGVARQRVAQLAVEHKNFPPEVMRTAAGPLYVEAQFDAWAQGWTRRAGRPRKTEAS